MASVSWQLYKSLGECNGYMLEKQIATDVTFIVGMSEDDTKKIKAHKYILISRSPVFFAMFCGLLPPGEGDDGIRISDVEVEAFLSMLRYMYTEETVLNPDIVLSTLYAAKKYMVTALVDKCIEFLKDRLNPSNVCLIFEECMLQDATKLMDKCINLIQNLTEDVFRSPSFPFISLDSLEKILSCDKLNMSELEIFNGCMNWAEAECKRRALEVVPKNKRLVLKDCFSYIRFPTMPIKDFANKVVPTDILLTEEKCAIFEYMTCNNGSSSEENLKFFTNPRQELKLSILERFTECDGVMRIIRGDCTRIQIKCDKSVVIKSFSIPFFTGLSAINITIKSMSEKEEILCYKSMAIGKFKSCDAVQVHLIDGVVCMREEYYIVLLTLDFSGYFKHARCHYGIQKKECITCDDVTFDISVVSGADLFKEIFFYPL